MMHQQLQIVQCPIAVDNLLVPTLPRGNAYGAGSWAEAVIHSLTPNSLIL